ncbi:hypothetical protein DFS34DRAFT_591016 [Phlyctochytrium arcticum]|nr:hypothetical protein DFS34DRAFT_591382 [Phlyctochytrium arcticum]KAI9103489.1 hypothetical protein DFS34DRAFT_591016 [Phlyctochytrium arcticum]
MKLRDAFKWQPKKLEIPVEHRELLDKYITKYLNIKWEKSYLFPPNSIILDQWRATVTFDEDKRIYNPIHTISDYQYNDPLKDMHPCEIAMIMYTQEVVLNASYGLGLRYQQWISRGSYAIFELSKFGRENMAAIPKKQKGQKKRKKQ